MTSSRIRAIAAIFAGLLGTMAAFAAPATVTYSTDVFSAPDKSGVVVGSVQGGMMVDVGGCQGYWCQIGYPGGTGWVPADAVAQAQPQPQPQPLPPPQPQPQPLPLPPAPWPQPQPPRPLPPAPPIYDDEAGACFYSERNFGGSSFCLEEGDSYSRLRNWNDRIRSVEVFGGAYVDLCSDRNLSGACVTLSSSSRRLPSQLDRRASSLEVY